MHKPKKLLRRGRFVFTNKNTESLQPNLPMPVTILNILYFLMPRGVNTIAINSVCENMG